MKKILFFTFLFLIVSCGGDGIVGYVGESITITAENPEETNDVDFSWILIDQPDGSLLSSKDLKYKLAGQEMTFSPDYPGNYIFEVSILMFGDELSNQSFVFTISDLEIEPEKEKTDDSEEEWLSEDMEEDVEEEDEYEEDEYEEDEYEEDEYEEDEYEEDNNVEGISDGGNDDYKDSPAIQKKYTVQSPKNTKPVVRAMSVKTKPAKDAHIPAQKDRFTIQIISKKQLKDAQQFAKKLIISGYDAYIQKAYFKETEEIWYRVRIGSYDNYNSAKAVADVVSSELGMSAWVDFVRLEN